MILVFLTLLVQGGNNWIIDKRGSIIILAHTGIKRLPFKKESDT